MLSVWPRTAAPRIRGAHPHSRRACGGPNVQRLTLNVQSSACFSSATHSSVNYNARHAQHPRSPRAHRADRACPPAAACAARAGAWPHAPRIPHRRGGHPGIRPLGDGRLRDPRGGSRHGVPRRVRNPRGHDANAQDWAGRMRAHFYWLADSRRRDAGDRAGSRAAQRRRRHIFAAREGEQHPQPRRGCARGQRADRARHADRGSRTFALRAARKMRAAHRAAPAHFTHRDRQRTRRARRDSRSRKNPRQQFHAHRRARRRGWCGDRASVPSRRRSRAARGRDQRHRHRELGYAAALGRSERGRP